MLHVDLKAKISPKIKTLQAIGVPLVNIAKLAKTNPSVLMQSTSRFGESVERRAVSLGFSPSDANFIRALHSVSATSVANFKRKVEACKKFGLTKDKILSLFKKNPRIMNLSKKNIRRSFGFFVEKLNWKPEVVFSYPVLLMLSLEKRIAPRAYLCETLASKELSLTEKGITPQMFLLPEDDFIRKYLKWCEMKCPELLEAYVAMKRRQ